MLRLKSIYKYGLLAYVTFLFCANCTQEEIVPVVVDFDVVVTNNDYSVPVTVQVRNTTSGAESYSWSFTGANITSSTDRNPEILTYAAIGDYTIHLEASNTDGASDSKTFTFRVDPAITVRYDTEIQVNNFAPATVAITNTTEGAINYHWTFEGGTPETSNQEQPGTVVFNSPGEHTITLVVDNGRETQELKKTITVVEALFVDFDWQVAFQDDDFQIPVTLTLNNTSISALDYNWSFTNADTATSTDENPTVTFTTSGEQTLRLTASNGKETKTTTKHITLFEDTNLRTFTDVQFGINTAHNSDTIGAFFSTTTREIYTKTQVAELDASILDIVFFGLSDDFSFNKFLSPDDLVATTFDPLANARQTEVINSQEQCACSASLSETQFDTMEDDSILDTLSIVETVGGSQHFTSAIVPRIVLFKTADGRKGAKKIKEFISNADNAYIVTDIKVQKE